MDFRMKKISRKQRLENMKLNIEEFLEMFPDPVIFFNDETKPVTENYKQHALSQLKFKFPGMRSKYIDDQFQAHNYHYTTTLKQLEGEATNYNPNAGNQMFFSPSNLYL